MKKLLLPAAAVAAALAFLEFRQDPPAAPDEPYGSLPAHFEPASVAGTFVSRGRGFALELGATGAQVHLARGTAAAEVSLRLEAASPAQARPENLLPGVSNYFLGDDPRAWRTGVPHYERVRYEDVYPGVDLVYYSVEGKLEYDFLLAPGADPARIRMSYDGADSVRVDTEGNLRVAVAGGELVHYRPVSYQVVDGARRSVQSAFRILHEAGKAIVSFELGAYDPRLALTIDPVLSYATYLGGTDDNDEMETLAVDSAGALYVAGQTNSIDYPVTPGAIQPAHNGMGQFDAFVAKLNPAGTAFEYVTYLGGSQNERAHIVRVDAAGNAYVAGETDSVNFPTSAGAAQTTSGGAQDVFVAKLNPTGTALLYSTYLGGAGGEPESTRLGGLVIDASGDVIIYGDTNSLDFPTSPGAPQTTRGNPNALQFDQDAFLTRINADGTAFVFSTYLGGSGFEEPGDPTQEHTLLEVDAAGTAWIAGTTESANFPASAGAFDATFGGGLNDGFVAHIDTSAGSILYSTYIGGAGDDMVMSLDTDSAGNAYVAIETTSGDFPTTPGSADTTYAGGGDIGVVKLNAAGSALVYGTLLGDGVADTPRVLRVDASGRAYIAGETRSTIIATPGAADTTFNGGLWDGFIARLNAAGTAFDYVTYAGGSDDDTLWFLEIDAAGSAYALLEDFTGDAFLTPGARPHGGDYDDYFVKVNPAGTAFLDASYYGGAGSDYATAMTIDAQENVYFAGITTSSDYPTTAGSPQPVKAGAAGADDTYLAKLSTTPATPAAQPGNLQLSASNYSVAENAGLIAVAVTRSGGVDGAVSVTCSAAAGGSDTATAGTDFMVTTVTLTWPAGDSANKTCDVPITDDAAVESAETFTVTLSGATGGASLGAPVTATVTIDDDDVAPVPQPGTVAFDPASYSLNENGGSVTLTLTRTAGADGAISVSVNSGGGSASSGADYTALSQTVSWADGDSANKTVSLTVLDDATDEPNETVTLTLSNATGGAALGTATATVTIVDDDLPPVPPDPPTQPTQVKARYGGAMDVVLLAMLTGLLGVTLYGRHRARRRTTAAPLAVVLAGTMLAGPAPEARADGWYAGMRVGVAESTQEASDVERALEALGHDVEVQAEGKQPAVELYGGYRWANGFAIEGGVFDLGEYQVDVSGETDNAAALLADTESVLADSGRGVNVALAWNWRIGERFEITPRIGAYYWESRHRVESEAGRVTDNEFGVDLMGGVTFACRIDDHWWLGVGYESWAANGRNDLRAVTASLSYRFGD